MIDINKTSPKEAADFLEEKFAECSVLQATIEAYNAINNEDMPACLFWNEVLKILNEQEPIILQ